jgi:hypothetical protein
VTQLGSPVTASGPGQGGLPRAARGGGWPGSAGCRWERVSRRSSLVVGGRRQLRQAWGVAVAFVAAGVLAAACGGCSASPRSPAAPPATALLVEFSACLRAHGLPNFPDPQSEAAGGGFPSGSLNPYLNPSANGSLALNDYTQQFQAAEKHCSSLARASEFIMTWAQIQAQTQQIIKREIAAVDCMRKHGVPNMPDPTAQGAMNIPPGVGIDPYSPQFKAAAKLCHGPQPGG